MAVEWKRRLMITGIVVGVLAGYRYLLPAGIPFLLSWILASWISPLAVRIEKKTRIHRGLAGTILLLLMLGIVGGVLFWGIMEALQQIRAAIASIPGFLKGGSLFLDKCCRMIEKTIGISCKDSEGYLMKHAEALLKQSTTWVSAKMLGNVFVCAKGALLFLSAAVITLISTVLLINDMDHIRKTMGEYSWLAGIFRIIKRLQKTTVTYLKAQLLIMLLVGAICTAGLWILHNPYFLLLGILLGMLDALPLIGTGTFLYPAALFLLVKEQPWTAAGCVLLDLITSFVREILEPRLLGGRLGISPIFVLASVYFGVLLYGGWGVVLGPLAFSTIFECGRECDLWD